MFLKQTIILIVLLTFTHVLAQFKLLKNPNIYSEDNFYLKDGKLYSDGIVINFKENVAGEIV